MRPSSTACILVASICLLGTSIGRAAPGGPEARKTVQIASKGKTQWRVRLPPHAGIVERFAAGELKKYVEIMSGAILRDSDRPDQSHLILLGQRKHLGPDVALPDCKPGHDGYTTAVSERSIVIAGENARGVVYGVYDLLEVMGCRWYYPTQDPEDPEIVPRRDPLTIEAVTRSVASPLKYRICNGSAWFFDVDLAAAGKELDWAMKNRYNSIGWQSESKTPLASQYERMRNAGLLDALDRRGMFLHGPGHSFDHFLKAGEYMKEHPEWFGMRDGKRVGQSFLGAQFCWSNASARKRFTDNLESFVKACPHIRILCVVPFDGGACCECPECKKARASNLLMVLMREVIERLEISAPGVQVESIGGYNPVTLPPGEVEVHPKQRIIWAHWGRYHGYGYDDVRYDRKANLETWRMAAPAGITICQYYSDNFSEPWIMPPFALAIQGDRRYFIERKIDSAYMLMWSPGYWWNHGLNGYLAGRCFYDASIDPFDEIKEYAVDYFGKDAGPLLADYYDQWAREIDLAYRVRDGSRDEDRAMLARQRREWIDAAVVLVKSDAVLSHRVGKVEKLHTLAERLTEVHRQRDEIRRLRKTGDLKKARSLLTESRTFTDGVLALFYELADIEQGLIERNEVAGFIKLRVKEWIDEEAKALGEEDQHGL